MLILSLYLCISVSLYLYISVAVSGELFQIKNWFEFHSDLLISFLKLVILIPKSRWNVDVSNEDWKFEIVILILKFELKKAYFWNYVIHIQKFGLKILLIWPWSIGFQVFEHVTVCSHIIMLYRNINTHILAYCA